MQLPEKPQRSPCEWHTHESTHKTSISPTHTINTNTCTCHLIYKPPPPLIFLSLSELRRSCLIPAWFIWIWIFYTSAQRPESNYSWTKTFPELSHIIPASATPSGQSNLSAFCIRDTDTAVILVYEKCVLHISLHLNITTLLFDTRYRLHYRYCENNETFSFDHLVYETNSYFEAPAVGGLMGTVTYVTETKPIWSRKI